MRMVLIAHRIGVVTLQEGGILQLFEVAARCREEQSTLQDALISENMDVDIRRALEPENKHGDNAWLFDHLYAMAEGRPRPETKVPDWIAIEVSKYWDQFESGENTVNQENASFFPLPSFGPSVASRSQINIDSLLNRAHLNYSNGNLAQAFKDYNSVIAIDPHNLRALVGMGCCYDENRQYQEALECYSLAIDLEPKLIYAYMNRGNTYGNLGQYEKAYNDQTKAIELLPKEAQCYYNRAVTCERMGRYEEVIQDCNVALSLNPFMPEAHFKLGNAYMKLRLYKDAINEYKIVLAEQPHNIDGLFNLGMCFLGAGEQEKALQQFEKAAQLGDNEARGIVQKLKGGKS